jgi:murein L,D-transpeptidase YcbB/YkuD
MRSKLKAAGYIIIEDKTYLTSSTYCVKGAIYVNEGKHTVCGLDNGSEYKKTLAKAGLTGTTSNQAQSSVKMESTTPKAVKTCTVKLNQLDKGAKGNSVKALQILLIGYGRSCGKSGADGDFGADTLKAVKAYQKAAGLDDDGIVGPATWSKLLGIK